MQVMKPEMYQAAEMVAVLTLLILAVACAISADSCSPSRHT